jgi:hypothetical protein
LCGCAIASGVGRQRPSYQLAGATSAPYGCGENVVSDLGGMLFDGAKSAARSKWPVQPNPPFSSLQGRNPGTLLTKPKFRGPQRRGNHWNLSTICHLGRRWRTIHAAHLEKKANAFRTVKNSGKGPILKLAQPAEWVKPRILFLALGDKPESHDRIENTEVFSVFATLRELHWRPLSVIRPCCPSSVVRP